MARIAGVDLPRDKHISISLTYIFGIGRTSAVEICRKAELDPSAKTRDLTDEEITRIRQVIEADFNVEGALRGQVARNIKRLMAINCYRGLRHKRGLPAHGQRTRTNARTRKGPKRTVGAKRKQ
jgi:small subunit ribosomal protein S13